MFKKPVFWLILVLLAVVSAFFSTTNFSRIMSMINLDITMNRTQALEKADSDFLIWQVGPAQYRQAVIFRQDSQAQYYIELEAGGKDAYNQFLQESPYQPYQWIVRHFQPGKEKEAYYYYTPSGELYGFHENVPETEEDVNISSYDALALVHAAAQVLNINLSSFNLAETAENTVISGRIDHTFVFERPEKLKDARYRLTITVAGSRVTSLKHSFKIPEAFSRRYEEMRSANNTIASAASYGMLFFYGLLGLGLGSFLLLRSHFLLYKNALLWAFIVSFLGFLANLNYLPLFWFYYDTSLSVHTHLTQTIMQFFFQFLQDFVLLALSFTVAESLTRRTFPKHTQLWKTFSAKASATPRFLGNTIGAYAMVPINIAFVLAFYFITAQKFGWWNPSSLQSDPNSLATPFPWLNVLATSLHAGFWEEALFRAVPLAGMLLIGKKLKKEKLFLALGLIIQAVIFAAAHANYPAQPAYARVVELIIPSLIFAFLYLRFGLYTAIILHYVFDVVLMAMFIWIMQTPGIWIHRICLILGILIPLLIFIYNSLRHKGIHKIPAELLNDSWQPAKVEEKPQTVHIPIQTSWNKSNYKYIIILSLIGALIWMTFTNITPHQQKITLSRSQALRIAQAEFDSLHVSDNLQWRSAALFINDITSSDKLVWKLGGKDIFNSAQGLFLSQPHWQVIFRSFSGDVASRAESYSFSLDNQGKIIAFNHKLPEETPADSLDNDIAKSSALSSLKNFFQLPHDYALTEVAAVPRKLPYRTDYTFTWKDTAAYPLKEGEFRYQAVMRGDNFMAASRYTYVPENWKRSEYNRSRLSSILKMSFSMLTLIIYLLMGVFAVIGWSKKQFNIKVFFFTLLILVFSTLLLRINMFPAVSAGFSTSQPWSNQLLQFLFGSFVQVFILNFIFAMIAGFLASWNNLSSYRLAPLTVFLAALAFAALPALAEILNPHHLPWKPDLSHLAHHIPLITTLTKDISNWVSSSIILIFLVKWQLKITQFGIKKKVLSFLIIFFFMLITCKSQIYYPELTDFAYVFSAVLLKSALFYWLVFKLFIHDTTVLPFFTAAALCLPKIRLLIAAPSYDAFSAGIISIIFTLTLSLLWMNLLRKYASTSS